MNNVLVFRLLKSDISIIPRIAPGIFKATAKIRTHTILGNESNTPATVLSSITSNR